MRILLFVLLFLAELSSASALQIFSRKLMLMGSDFEITVVERDTALANQAIDLAVAEISRIESLISSWKPNSQCSAINSNAGISAVQVDQELFELIERSIALSKLTDGAFDLSYASMDRIWKFDGSMTAMPTSEMITNSVSKVGFEHIHLDHRKLAVFLEKEGMKIGFGAIGKGYAADRAKELLQKRGVSAGIINASGDMNCWGVQPGGKPWTVAITNPVKKSDAFAHLPIRDGAVVTSGNYEKFVQFDGKRYAHIIDPRSGYPTTGIASVTVFAAKAELADALATAVFVMGTEPGIDRINQLPQIECIIVDDQGALHYSNDIKIERP